MGDTLGIGLLDVPNEPFLIVEIFRSDAPDVAVAHSGIQQEKDPAPGRDSGLSARSMSRIFRISSTVSAMESPVRRSLQNFSHSELL
ncbi:MAG: hypothetical protein IPG73_11940 [Ignavibacteria bacterium]|nr:hypothetical protein [Ignavibacteria bacterium]